LYKIVNEEYKDFWTDSVLYKIGTVVNCPDFDENSALECGKGLHLSPTIDEAKQFNQSGHILKCLVDKKDVFVFEINPQYPNKVRCRKVFVKEEVF